MTKNRVMSSMFDISLPLANSIYTWANALLVLGAVSAFVGTAGVIWSGGIRERHSDERIAANEAETARAKAEAAKAQWAAAGFIDTLLRWKMKLEVVHGNEKAIQPGVQA